MGSEEVPDSTCRGEERNSRRGVGGGRTIGRQAAYSEEVCDVDSSVALVVHITKELWRKIDHASQLCILYPQSSPP